MPLNLQQSARVKIGPIPGLEWWIQGGDLYLVSAFGKERRISEVLPDFLGFWRGDNLDALRRAPFYNPAWEDPKANPKAEPIRSDLAPTPALRDENFGAPTPASVPGGTVISSLETWQAIVAAYGRSPQERPVVLAAIDNVLSVPGAYGVSFAGQGGNFNDSVQQRLQTIMATLAPNKRQMVVAYCHHENCWLSYNLVLRLAALGYTNLRWLREGLEVWAGSGLPIGLPTSSDALAPTRQ